MIAIKRAYEPPADSDGVRILVDKLWPRGRTKEVLRIRKWMKDLGPSDELRRFFGHNPARWNEFRKRYLRELERPDAAPLLDELLAIARASKLTLVYGAKDVEHNQAVVLKDLLETKLRNA